MSQISDDIYRSALRRSVEAKREMDRAIAALERAEDEWSRANQALDDLEGYPESSQKEPS